MSYDSEKIVSDYLRVEIGTRIVAQPPPDRDRAWVQLIELAAPQDANSQHDHLVAHYMQLSCYAGKEGGPPEANAIGGAVREALVELSGVHDGVVITATRIEGSFRDSDPTLDPARPRRIITATVWMHP